MNMILEVTSARPWALAFCLAVRDALALEPAGIPRTACAQVSAGPDHLTNAWRSWWDSLLRTAATPRGLAVMTEQRDPVALLPADPGLRAAMGPLTAPVRTFVDEWLTVGEEGEPPFRVGHMSPLAEGIQAAGFQTQAGRRRTQRLLGRALPDDLVVVIVPVLGEWGQVTRFGSVVVSSVVAQDAATAERWFRTELWTPRR